MSKAIGLGFGAAVLCGALLAAYPTAAPAPDAAPAARTAVVAELFTSEGCSSCPPADDVLTELAARQPIPGVEVLALGEHVDYWDRLGWRDPFSSAELSARQSEYGAQVFRTNRIYTPQIVVDGAFETVGSDAAAVRQAINRAAKAVKASVDVAALYDSGARAIRVDARVEVPGNLAWHGPADLVTAVVEDNLVTNVRRGENRGRTLRHTAVVRTLAAGGSAPHDERAWSTTASLPVGSNWTPANLRVVAFLQDRTTRRIAGGAAAHVAAEPTLAGGLNPITFTRRER